LAKLIFGMNQSLDGYIDHRAFAPGQALFRHIVTETEALAGSIYGRNLYEIMRYWDEDRPVWTIDEQAFAAAWRRQPKWVVSRTLRAVGPNASLLEGDLDGAIRKLKAECQGEIEVAGPNVAQSLTALGLIMSIGSTCILSCLAKFRPISLDHVRHFDLCRMTGLMAM
jgi:dihydrofolate reductase